LQVNEKVMTNNINDSFLQHAVIEIPISLKSLNRLLVFNSESSDLDFLPSSWNKYNRLFLSHSITFSIYRESKEKIINLIMNQDDFDTFRIKHFQF